MVLMYVLYSVCQAQMINNQTTEGNCIKYNVKPFCTKLLEMLWGIIGHIYIFCDIRQYCVCNMIIKMRIL